MVLILDGNNFRKGQGNMTYPNLRLYLILTISTMNRTVEAMIRLFQEGIGADSR